MAKRRQLSRRSRASGQAPAEQLDRAVEAIMADGPTLRVSRSLDAILRIAADLRDLPRADLKARLKAQLSRARVPRVERGLERSAIVQPIRQGFHSITPYFVVEGAAKMIDFLKQAFGAEELSRIVRPDGRIAHAELRIEGSMVELGDATPEYRPSPAAIWLFVNDADAVYERALKAGASSTHEPMDQDYGNREASVRDPFGNHWYIATPLPDRKPWPEELRSVTPYLHPIGAARLIDFMKNAFDAKEVERHEGEGMIQHAQLRIGDSIIAIGEAHGPYQPMPPALHLYVPDTDATYKRALRAGAISVSEPADQPYGDRFAGVKDPLGNQWYIATHKKDLPSEKPSELEAERERNAPTTKNLPSVMPFIYVKGPATAAEFYKKVFGATELMREVDPSGIVSHVQIKIGDSRFMLRDPSTPDVAEYVAKGFARTPQELGGTPVHLYLYVEDADAAFNRALASGSKLVDPLEDKEWGDRCGGIRDPFGLIWYIATPIKHASQLKR
jgi:PhnB protein